MQKVDNFVGVWISRKLFLAKKCFKSKSKKFLMSKTIYSQGKRFETDYYFTKKRGAKHMKLSP